MNIIEAVDNDEALLQPIDQVAPAGLYLRYDPVYDRIAQARTENDALPQGVWQRPTLQADWSLVENLCTDILAHRSKDMQLAVWRTEALLHLHGLSGYNRGCRLILDLHQQFAATMHPAPELPSGATVVLPLPSTDPAVEHRMNMVQWLNEKLSVKVKMLPLTAPNEINGLDPFSLADLEASHYHVQAQQRQGSSGAKPSENKVKLFENSLGLTPLEWLLALRRELNDATEITAALDDALDACYGSANSGLLQLKQVLEQMSLAIAPAFPKNDAEWEQTVGEATMPSVPETLPYEEKGYNLPRTDSASQSLSPSNPTVRAMSLHLHNREEAYLRLAEISDFLSQIEPHSPVPYLLRRAIAWGGMSLQELLPELLHDQAALRDVNHMLRLNGDNDNPNTR
jgi:type VI secretion system protein ImpA